MIFEHEIPTGSKLYFGKLAKQKRDLEKNASDFLYENGFEEIITPTLSYLAHQSIDDEKELITLNDELNNKVVLRADSTLDVVRIITKRLGRTTLHKKWFYIQPIFKYPANEAYQIGLEWINYDNFSDLITLNCKLLDRLNSKPTIQIANINIPKIISKQWDIDIELFKDGEIGALSDLEFSWLNNLISVVTIKDLEDIYDGLPDILKPEIKKLLDISKNIDYSNITLSPIYYDAMKYYDDVYYKVIEKNITIAKGGGYKSNGIKSLGFAIYTDQLLKVQG